MMRLLEAEEKKRTRVLYQNSFPEDSPAFVDYYYREKTKDNEIFVREEEGEIQVMLHLNPYVLSLYGHTLPVSYIVAVATDPKARKQGKMYALMGEALRYLYEKKQPLTYLMPADPAYYYSTGFSFLPAVDLAWQKEEFASLEALKKGEAARENPAWSHDGKEEMPQEAAVLPYGKCGELHPPYSKDFLERQAAKNNGVLRENHDFFLQRNALYYKRMLEEAACPGEEIPPSMFRYMVRIVDIRRLCPLLKSRTRVCIKARIGDRLIPENNGSFAIDIDGAGGRIEEIEEKETGESMEIGALAGRLFADTRVFLREWV